MKTASAEAVRRHTAFPGGAERSDLIAWYRRNRARTAQIFHIPSPESFYTRPIDVRNPIVFYDGHIPAFSVNTLIKGALGRPGIDDELEVVFERGIDPASANDVHETSWPDRDRVRRYVAEADRLIEAALHEDGDAEPRFTILEHEQMHQETFLYMLHNLPHETKSGGQTILSVRDWTKTDRIVCLPQKRISIPAGTATLGQQDAFGWDNEFPSMRVDVAAFEIDRHNVTNGQYLEYVNATGASAPHFWIRNDDQWFWRGMFALVPLPLDWPVYVTYAEAGAYSRWAGGRVPTEAEYHRAAFGTPSGVERQFPWGDEPADATRGNFDFQNLDPVPAGSYPAGASAWGVHDLVGNGWEWTSTIFDGFPGFSPMRSYPNYSKDFFDGQHYVLKGASPVTARELVRRSFRNWFRPNYQYLYATFRTAR